MARSYRELANAQIGDRRKLVISEHYKDNERCGFTLAQQLEAMDGKKVVKLFLKGGIHLAGIENLVNLRDALNVAIDTIASDGENEKKC